MPSITPVSERDILNGLDAEDNARVLCIANYPSKDLVMECDEFAREIAPPNNMWDKFVHSGGKKNYASGWHRFEGEYMQYLSEDDDAFEQCKQLKAQLKVRPVYLCHHTDKMTHSPARLAADYIKHSVSLESGEQKSIEIWN